jgi:hypothetical protein
LRATLSLAEKGAMAGTLDPDDDDLAMKAKVLAVSG